MTTVEIISNIVIAIGLFFMIMGAVGIFRFSDFYQRILMASKVDTVGMLTLLIGLGIRHGTGDIFFTLKLVFIAIIVLILSPLVAHVMARSAYVSGYMLKGEIYEEPEDEKEEADWSENIME